MQNKQDHPSCSSLKGKHLCLGQWMELKMLNTELIQFLWHIADDALIKAQVAKPETRSGFLAEAEELLTLAASVRTRPSCETGETRKWV